MDRGITTCRFEESPRTPRRGAFTLIELLVVIGVIALLAGLLLPTLSLAKVRAKRVWCMNNQKQLITTWALYSSDHNELMVATGMLRTPSTVTKLWVQGAFFNINHNRRSELLLDPTYALFAPYLKTPKVYLCPTDRDSITIGGESYPRIRSYALNAYLGWVGEWDDRLAKEFRVFKRQSQLVAMPAGTFVFQDVNPDSICWPYFGVQMAKDSIFNFPNSSHGRGGVISFADGHVEHHRWEDPRTIAAHSRDYHKHQDASPGNRDLAWLRRRTTVR